LNAALPLSLTGMFFSGAFCLRRGNAPIRQYGVTMCHAMPPGATCSPASKDTPIVSGFFPLGYISPGQAERQAASSGVASRAS